MNLMKNLSKYKKLIMSDAICDSLKKDFWKKFFNTYMNEIVVDLELIKIIDDYVLMSTIKHYPSKLEYTKRLKKNIMLELSKYNKFPNDDMMFRDEFRFPNDYYIFNVLEKIEKIKTK